MKLKKIKSDVKKTLVDVINNYYYCKDFSEIAVLKFSDLSIDSLDQVEMVMSIEEKLKVSISDEELTKLEYPLQLFRILLKKVLTKEQRELLLLSDLALKQNDPK